MATAPTSRANPIAAKSLAATRVVGATPWSLMARNTDARVELSAKPCCWSTQISSKPPLARYSAIWGSAVVSQAPRLGLPARHSARSGLIDVMASLRAGREDELSTIWSIRWSRGRDPAWTKHRHQAVCDDSLVMFWPTSQSLTWRRAIAAGGLPVT